MRLLGGVKGRLPDQLDAFLGGAGEGNRLRDSLFELDQTRRRPSGRDQPVLSAVALRAVHRLEI